MPIYKYVAKDIYSNRIREKMSFNSREELHRYLRQRNLYLLKCEEVETQKEKSKLKLDELSQFCRQVSMMLKSGMSLIMAINTVAQKEPRPKLKKMYKDIYVKLNQGVTLSQALQMQDVFPLLMINMIKASESTGLLDQTLSKLAVQFEKNHKINAKVKTAMFYPMLLGVITVGVLLLVFTVVLPSFLDLFERTTMPWITKVMFGISDLILNHSYLLLIVSVGLILGIRLSLRIDSVRLAFDQIKIKIPKVGKLLKVIYTARFARSMSSLYSSGVSMITALNLAKGTINNQYIEKQFDEVIQKVKNGSLLSSSIQGVEGFDEKLINYVYVGEESGRLDEMLEMVADDFDFEAEMAIEKLVNLLQPIMVIILGIVICSVVVSVLLPVYELYGNISAG